MEEYKKESLWLSLQLENEEYCILSEYIDSIIISGKIQPAPGTPPSVAGMLAYAETTISVYEMREVFGRMNLKKYVEQFGIMKDMHVSWVKDLEKYVNNGGTFDKELNPHKCKFGIWYDNFRTENKRLIRILKKINAPHDRIHKCGEEIIELRSKGFEQDEEIEEKLEEAKRICHEDIVPLLDKLIDVYKAINRGVIVVVGDDLNKVGLLVDNVKQLIPCKSTEVKEFTSGLKGSPYIKELVVNDKKIMLEIDIEKILEERLEGKNPRLLSYPYGR